MEQLGDLSIEWRLIGALAVLILGLAVYTNWTGQTLNLQFTGVNAIGQAINQARQRVYNASGTPTLGPGGAPSSSPNPGGGGGQVQFSP